MTEELVGGRYRRLQTIGRGAVGEVFLADDLVLGRRVAIKQLRLDPLRGVDNADIERMSREARVAARMHHPNVVTVFDLISEGGHPCVVMEFIDGESLAERIRKRGPLPVGEARRIIGQVARALDAAHSIGIVHRDVKPANIMIDRMGVAKLADFGIARGHGDAVVTDTGQMIGTIAYMAPEVARGQAATPASDIWSLGATLFAAIEGRAPYEDSTAPNPTAMLIRLISEPIPESVRAGELQRALSRMLQTDPARRPTAREVVSDIAQLDAQVENPARSSAASPPAVQRPEEAELTRQRPQLTNVVPDVAKPPPPRRRVVRVAVTAAVVLLMAGGITAAVVGLGSHHKASATSAGTTELQDTEDGASAAASSDGKQVYLPVGDAVAQVDVTSDKVLGVTPLDHGMRAVEVVAATTGHQAYVSEVPATIDPFHEPGKGAGALALVDLDHRTVVRRLALCGNPLPRGMVLNKSGNWLFVGMDSCQQAVNVPQLTATTGGAADLKAAPVPAVGGIGMRPDAGVDGYTVRFVDGSGRECSVNLGAPGAAGPPFDLSNFTPFGAATRGVLANLQRKGGGIQAVLSPNGHGATTSGPGHVGLFPLDETGGKRPLHDVTVGNGIYAAAWAPPRSNPPYLVVVASGEAPGQSGPATLVVVDLRTSSLPSWSVTLPGGRGTIALSADGRSVFVSTTTGAISLVNLSTHAVTRLGGGPWLSRSLDGRTVYASSETGRIVAFDGDTGAVRATLTAAP